MVVPSVKVAMVVSLQMEYRSLKPIKDRPQNVALWNTRQIACDFHIWLCCFNKSLSRPLCQFLSKTWATSRNVLEQIFVSYKTIVIQFTLYIIECLFLNSNWLLRKRIIPFIISYRSFNKSFSNRSYHKGNQTILILKDLKFFH